MESTGKLTKKLVLQTADMLIERNNKLGEIQGAYRKGRNILENLFIISQLQEIAQIKKMPLHTIAVDLSKAFDRVDREKNVGNTGRRNR